jgi:molybdate transport repressor ModE-like protein
MELSPHVPDLAGLALLLDIAQVGSLNRAAQRAGVSQQAASERVRSMEAQTGLALLHRTPRGSRLTVEGEVIAEWATQLLDVAARMETGIAALRADRRSRLRVSASSTIAEQLLPAWLASFRVACGLAAEIVLTAANTETVIAHVTTGQADIGFIEGPRQPHALRSRVIGHDQLTVVVAPGHPWARRRRPVSAAELASTPLVSREGGSGTKDALAAALATALGPGAAQAPAALSLSTTAAVRAAVLAAAAPAVISDLAVADDLAAGRLLQIPVSELDLHRELRVVWDGAKQPPPGLARDLITHILSRHQRRQPSRPSECLIHPDQPEVGVLRAARLTCDRGPL